MPYAIEFIEKEAGLIVTWTGTVKGAEIIRSYHERFSPQERWILITYILSDYSHADTFDMSADDVRIIAKIANKAAPSNRKLCGVAVMPTDIEFGVARMFQSYVDDDTTGWRTYVTRSRVDAEEWLRKNLNPALTFKNPARP